VYARSTKTAGDKMNEDIINFAQEEYKLLIGERTAETIKIGIGSASTLKEKMEMPLRGRNIITGLPEEIMVSDEDIRKAIERSVRQITNEVKVAVEETPPELLADIMAKGIHLSGGGALLRQLEVLIGKETKIPTKVVEDPLTAVVRGAGLVLENLDDLSDVIVETDDLEPPR
ncbi:rod shape-determining protein, partial [Patescibacteria group bacterium]|nr:rod shape-determining protein [Patescibacteria group bacterium]